MNFNGVSATLSCAKDHVKGRVINVNQFHGDTANPWTDTTNQNAANWAGAIIRARSPIGSNLKQKVSVIPPSIQDARIAAEIIENTYIKDEATVTIKTSFGTYTIPASTECKVMVPETEEQKLARMFN